MNQRLFIAVVIAIALSIAVASSLSADPPAGETVTVLDLDRGSFSAFMVWRTPTVIAADGKLAPLREPARKDVKDEDRKPVPVRESTWPAKDWASPTFDDSDWCRMHGPAAVTRAGEEWRLVCLRGRFMVTDPAQAGDLTLTLSYYGGVRVFVNGQELTRASLPAGEVKPDTFADRYPDEAYIRPDGKLYGQGDFRDKALVERMKVRVRVLTAGGANSITVPAKLLRKGLNVLAIESISAPISAVAFNAPPADRSDARDLCAHAGVAAARLDSPAGNGLISNARATPDIQIGNVPAAETLMVSDFVHPAESLRPVRLVGARNGVFSGRVLLSSAQTIRGLKASVSDLMQATGSGKLPASAISIRWAEAATPEESWRLEDRFDRLLADPPAEVSPRKVQARNAPAGLTPVAAIPVWVTVRVPADATPGDYKASVTITAQGAAAAQFAVPVELKVSGWKVPDPNDFTVINNICQSPDSVAQYYKLPLWSDEHLKRIARSLDILHQVGNRTCVLNLVAGAHGYGNAESMVRWVKKDDGSYDHDFSVVDKYLDTFEKACGKPLIVQVTAWQFPGDNPEKPKWSPASVTVVDKDGKRVADLDQPAYGTPENEAFWRPVLTELRKRLEKRGWFENTYVGWLSYCHGPGKDVAEVVKSIWPDAKWIKNAHQMDKAFQGMPVKCCGWVWGAGALYDPDCATPWGRRPEYSPDGRKAYPEPWTPGKDFVSLAIPRVGVAFVRPGMYDHSPLMRFRTISEAALQGNLRGLAMVGGDFWPLPMGAKGRLATVCTGHGAVTSTNNTLAITSPGPDGAIFNERLEMFREGIQVAEAMIFLRKALTAKAVDDALAGRIAVLLDGRARRLIRNNNPLPVGPGNDPGCWLTGQCTDWAAHDAELFDLAGEVSAAMSSKPRN